MKRHPLAVVGVVILAIVVAFGLFLAGRHPVTEASNAPSPLVGHAAPLISATALDSPAVVSLTALRGRDVVVNFWASWCQPCESESPELSTFAWQQSRHTGGAVLLGVVFNDYATSARAFERRLGALYSSVLDPEGKVANAYGVVSPPTTFVINRHGKIVASFVGPVTAAQLTSAVNVADQ